MLALWAATLGVSEISNNDIWLHLRTGELILAQGDLPRADTYSFTAEGRPWVAHEWLAAVLFQLVYGRWGVDGLIAAKALIVAATAGLLALAAARAGAPAWATILGVAPGVWIAASRFWVRPHLFSWLLTALYLLVLFSYARGGRRARWLLLLLPFQVLWANLHGGGAMGVMLLGVLALAEALEGLRESAAAALARARVPALAALAALGASLLNPWGARALVFPLELTSMRLYMERIYEWQPPWHASYNASPMLAAWVIFACGLLAALFALPARAPARPGARRSAGRILAAAPLLVIAIFLVLRVAGAPVWGPIPCAILLSGLPVLLVLFAVGRRGTAEPLPVLLTLVFLLLSMRHNRAVADAALATSVILAASLPALFRRRPPALTREGRRPVLLASGAVVAACACVAFLGYPLSFGGPARPLRMGIGREAPACAAGYVARNGLSGRAFVSYQWGALLVHAASPRVKVSIDSRNEVYGEEIYRAHLEALRSPESMERFLDRYRVDMILLDYADPSPPLARWLSTAPAWAPVFMDEKGFLLVRRSSAPAGLVERDAYTLLRPAALGGTRLTPANAATALAEADRAIESCRDSFFGWFYRAKALLALGRHEEAIGTSRRATEIDPSNPTAWADLGYALAASGDFTTAAEMYARALALDPDDEGIRENLRRLRTP